MPNGDLWRLPDGRRAIEVARTERCLNVVPVLPGPPFMGPPELHWRASCIKQPSRYLHGAIRAEPDEDTAHG